MRQGPEVIWRDWRSSTTGDPLPEVRFDAADYDREVARAEQDHAWEWPARTLARLVADRLRADPSILGRWDCTLGGCTAWVRDVDIARVTFQYQPGREASADWVQFGLLIDVRDQSPERVAAKLVEAMTNTDPKTLAETIGGSREMAERLGVVFRKPIRWRAADVAHGS